MQYDVKQIGYKETIQKLKENLKNTIKKVEEYYKRAIQKRQD